MSSVPNSPKAALVYSEVEIATIHEAFRVVVDGIATAGHVHIFWHCYDEDRRFLGDLTPTWYAKARILHGLRWGFMGGQTRVDLPTLLNFRGGVLRAVLLGGLLRVGGALGLAELLKPVSDAIIAAEGRKTTTWRPDTH